MFMAATSSAGEQLEIVERLPIQVQATPENAKYLQTKRDRLGHLLDLDPTTNVIGGAS